MPNNKEERFLEKLQYLVETSEIADVLTTPITESIENLLKVSASAVNSDGASVLVRKGDEGELQFVWAIGSVSNLLINMTVPEGKGVAGFVFSSGQPIAVSDTERETDFYAEVDKNTGFATHSILATPLRFEDEVIGVLEYVNRKGNPPFEPFTSEEMDLAAVYADAIASLVYAYESANMIGGLSKKVFDSGGIDNITEIRAWLEEFKESGRQKEMIELAFLLRALSARGDAERALCREVIESFLQYFDRDTEGSYSDL